MEASSDGENSIALSTQDIMSTDHVDGLVQMEEEGFEDELMVEYGTSEDEEMEKSEEVHVRSLPMEVWVQVFHYLPGPSLFTCEGVCRSWQHEVRHQVTFLCHPDIPPHEQVMTGCIPRRGLRLSRLTTIPGAVTEHRRRTWDTLSIMADRRVLLVCILCTSICICTSGGCGPLPALRTDNHLPGRAAPRRAPAAHRCVHGAGLDGGGGRHLPHSVWGQDHLGQALQVPAGARRVVGAGAQHPPAEGGLRRHGQAGGSLDQLTGRWHSVGR